MNPLALTIMLLAQVTIACFTIYFFFKVLRSPGKEESDFPPGP